MIFKRNTSFFLDLSKPGGKAVAGEPASSPAPDAPEPSAEPPSGPRAEPSASAPSAPAQAPAAEAGALEMAAAADAAAPLQPALTTAEAIAAELRAVQEARPAPSQVTFAPECLNPANAVPTPRRRAGANLGVFKGMVDEMFRS
ncbi:MAG: hypothetical protein AAFX65_07830 [Cyanobacteria bacterium J06638_7]